MTIIAILYMRFESETKALNSAKRFKDCPKIHFWAIKERDSHIILKVPNNNKMWSDYIQKNPEKIFGGVESQLTYVNHLIVPNSVEGSYEKIEGYVAPCGSFCKKCPAFGPCTGCPALNLEYP